MTNENNGRSRFMRARLFVRALIVRGLAGLSDAVGIAGLFMLGRGLWLQFGEAWALIGVGLILLAVSLASAVRGGD